MAYRVTSDTVGPSQGRQWQADPWLSDAETLEPDDYDDAPGALRVDRGHQAPLAAFSGTPFGQDTKILSNITPQRSALNQASWQYLEAQERRLVARAQSDEPLRELYVLTGPLYERILPSMPMPNGYERHRLPSAYWKVLATPDGRIAAFSFDQDTPRSADYCSMGVPLDEVEMRADLELFPRRQDRTFVDLTPELGCAPLPVPHTPP